MEHNQLPQASPYPNPAFAAPSPRPEPTPAPPGVALWAALLALWCSALAYPTLFSRTFIDYIPNEISVYVDAPMGVNIPLAVLAVYAAFFLAMRGQRKICIRKGWPLFPVVGLIALSFALYSVTELMAVNFLALATLVPLHLSLLSGGNWPKLTGAAFYAQAAYDIFARPFAFLSDSCRTALGGSKKGALRTAMLALAGLAIALPVLAVVTVLLAAADERFESLIENLFRHIDVPQIIGIIILAGMGMFLALSCLYSLPLGKKVERVQAEAKPGKGIHPVPVYAALAALNLILVLFAGIQIQRLFGELLLTGAQHAQYAHESFFPMTAAALICYGAQALCLNFTRREGKALPLRVLVTTTAASLLVMMVSAFRAILLYQQAFGLTRLRVYVTFCIAALFLLLVFTLLKIWRRIPYRAMAFAVLIAALVGVNYMNLDRTIAAYNVRLAQSGGQELDAYYLASLSPDALVVCIGEVEGSVRDGHRPRGKLYAAKVQNEDIRVWNLGRARAAAAFDARYGEAARAEVQR